jgi:hypothetical protein
VKEKETGWKAGRKEGIKEEKKELNGTRDVILRKMEIPIGLCFVKSCACHM